MSSAPSPKTIRQHFVPRSYLLNFKSDAGTLWVYDKKSGKTFPSGENAVAFEKLFYDLEPGSLAESGAEVWNEGEYGEKAMIRFEQELQKVIGVLTGDAALNGIPASFRHTCAFSMAIQYLRTSHYRRLIAQQASSLLDSLRLEMVKLNYPGQEHLAPTGALTNAGLRHQHMRALLDHDMWRTVGDSIESHHWTLCIAPAGAFFNTSDNPVSRRPHLAKRGKRYCGFRSKGMEVFYPVSRRCGLLARERTFHKPDPTTDGAPRTLSKGEVHRLNKIVAGNCERFVFGPSENFAVTHHFFECNPHLRDEPWEQWETTAGKVRKVKGADGETTELRQRTEGFFKFVSVNWEC